MSTGSRDWPFHVAVSEACLRAWFWLYLLYYGAASRVSPALVVSVARLLGVNNLTRGCSADDSII